MKKTRKGLALMCVIGLSSFAQAFNWFDGRLSIGGGVGRAKPKLPYSFQSSYEDGLAWSGHLKYFLNDRWSVVASYADLQTDNKATSLPIRFRPVVGSVRFNLFRGLPITPYITAGAGASFNKKDRVGAPATKWDKFTYQAGLGFEFFITQSTAFGAEALYHHFESEGNGIAPYRFASAMGTMNIYFGAGPKERQARQDAEEARRRADEEARRAAQSDEQRRQAEGQVQSAQAQTEAAQAQAQSAMAQKTEAERKAAEAQARQQQAQAEVDAIKEMVARKDINPFLIRRG